MPALCQKSLVIEATGLRFVRLNPDHPLFRGCKTEEQKFMKMNEVLSAKEYVEMILSVEMLSVEEKRQFSEDVDLDEVLSPSVRKNLRDGFKRKMLGNNKRMQNRMIDAASALQLQQGLQHHPSAGHQHPYANAALMQPAPAMANQQYAFNPPVGYQHPYANWRPWNPAPVWFHQQHTTTTHFNAPIYNYTIINYNNGINIEETTAEDQMQSEGQEYDNS